MILALSPEAYLEAEISSQVRHEYVDGRLLEMPGASRTHSRIVKNILKALDDLCEAQNCELHAVDVKLQVGPSRFRYPDIMISCAAGSDPYVLANPCFIAEVTSDSTSSTDSGVKLDEYTKLPNLECYAIISQSERSVIIYRPENGLWTFDAYFGSGQFEIPNLGISLSLEQIYAGVNF